MNYLYYNESVLNTYNQARATEITEKSSEEVQWNVWFHKQALLKIWN